MKKLIVDCSRPIGQQETVVEMTQEEQNLLLQTQQMASSEAVIATKSQEQRIAELEEKIKLLAGEA